jgi:hypothetical protein
MGIEKIAGTLTYWLGVEIEKRNPVSSSESRVNLGAYHLCGTWDGWFSSEEGLFAKV